MPNRITKRNLISALQALALNSKRKIERVRKANDDELRKLKISKGRYVALQNTLNMNAQLSLDELNRVK